MLSSSSEERDIVESYKLGAKSYVVKPVDVLKFIDANKVLGQYWAVINQPPPERFEKG
jgi:two-component system response regulator